MIKKMTERFGHFWAGNREQATGNRQRATSNGQRATSNGQRGTRKIIIEYQLSNINYQYS
jgi:hypothetical protein